MPQSAQGREVIAPAGCPSPGGRHRTQISRFRGTADPPQLCLPPEPLTSRGRAKPCSPFTAGGRELEVREGLPPEPGIRSYRPGNSERGPGTLSHRGDSGRPCVLPGCVHYKCKRALEPTRVSFQCNGRMRLWAWSQRDPPTPPQVPLGEATAPWHPTAKLLPQLVLPPGRLPSPYP